MSTIHDSPDADFPSEVESEQKHLPPWVPVFGAALVVLSLGFLISLIVVPSLQDAANKQPFLVVLVVAICMAMGAGLISGYAKAEGSLNVPGLDTPIKVGMAGGFAFFFLVLIFGWFFLF